MASSGMGKTTTVKRENDDALFRTIRACKAKMAATGRTAMPVSVSDTRDVDMRGWRGSPHAFQGR